MKPELMAVPLVLLIGNLAAYLLSRRQEILDSQDRPVMRWWGAAAIIGALGLGSLLIPISMILGFQLDIPTGAADVVPFFAMFTLIVAGWFTFGWRYVLTADSVEVHMWPLRLVYPLNDYLEVARKGTNSIIVFKPNRRIGVLWFMAGRGKFLEDLAKRVEQV
jgi:hypothetical protein